MLVAKGLRTNVAFFGLLLFAVCLSLSQVLFVECGTIAKDYNPSLVQPPKNEPRAVLTLSSPVVNTSYSRPPLFNPWRDFVFTNLSNGTTTYSSHTCVAAAQNKRRSDAVSRTCWYQNLYYHVSTKKFHYFPHPTERIVLSREKKLVEDMGTTISHVRESLTSEHAINTHSECFIPEMHLEENDLPPSNVKLASANNGRRPLLELYRGSMANYGHMIWDDFLSMYMQLDLFDLLEDDELFPIPFVKDPKTYLGGSYCLSYNEFTWPQCIKFYKRLYPSMWNVDTDCSGDVVRTGNWLQGQKAIGTWNRRPSEMCGDYRDLIVNTVDSEYVLVPNMTVRAGRLAYFTCYGECTLGRASNSFHFRNYLLRRMLGDNHATNPKGYITFSLAHGATCGAGEVSFFTEEIRLAKIQYGKDAVRAVNFATMSAQEQGLLISNSAALFTNHGGGSMSTVFLPKGSLAFVYWRSQQRDNEFYRSVSYFRAQWIEYRQRQDMQRTKRILEMELTKTALMYPSLVCFSSKSS